MVLIGHISPGISFWIISSNKSFFTLRVKENAGLLLQKDLHPLPKTYPIPSVIDERQAFRRGER
jgi:hypothetical protein